MSEEKTFTKADVDAAISKALSDAGVDGLKAKNDELLGEVKALKTKLRSATEISPEDVAALESENDRLKAELGKAQKEAKDATKAAETATKALEAEQGAARSYALDAELAGAIAEGNVIASLVPGFKAMMASQAKADLVEGKYSVTIGDKPAREHIKAFLDSEDGKAWRAAQANGGGGAPGSGGGGGDVKTMTRSQYNQQIVSDPKGTSEFIKGGGKIVADEAA